MKVPCHRGHEIRLGITEMIGPAPQGCVGVAPVQGTEQRFVLGVQVVERSVGRTQQRDHEPDLPSWPDEHPQPPLRGPAATVPETTESRRPRSVN
jgi:hypothetical protein